MASPVKTALLLMALALMTGCGLKGDLFLPEPEPETESPADERGRDD